MARKSEIRATALAALGSLSAAGKSSTDEEAAGHLSDALAKLTEAAGLAEPGKGAERLREAGRAESNGLLARLQRPDEVPLRERDFSTAERTAMAKRGHALPVKNDRGEIVGGRYPIETRADVENAVSDADRTGAGRKVRKHIIRQAQRVGAPDVIPKAWTGSRAKEAAALSLRESVAVGEASLLEVASPDAREDRRLPLLDRMGIDRDYLA